MMPMISDIREWITNHQAQAIGVYESIEQIDSHLPRLTMRFDRPWPAGLCWECQVSMSGCASDSASFGPLPVAYVLRTVEPRRAAFSSPATGTSLWLTIVEYPARPPAIAVVFSGCQGQLWIRPFG